MSEVEQLREEVRGLRSDVKQLVELLVPIAVNGGTQSERARRAGVSRQTLWRRQQKARARILAAGRIPL